MTRALLTVGSLAAGELGKLVDLADELKAGRPAPGQAGRAARTDLRGVAVALLFASPTPVRAAFEVAVAEVGGTAVVVADAALPAGDGEELTDAVRTLSCYAGALVVRTPAQSRLERVAAASAVPVLNAGSSFADPCQAVADLQTIREYKGGLDGLKLAYLGDGTGVANSLLRAGTMAGMHVAIASPPGYEPIPQVVDSAKQIAHETGATVEITTNPLEAARGADVVYTDAWVRPGGEAERDARMLIFRPFQVGYHVMEAARPDAIVMHPLPATRGAEIAADVLDGQQSVVWTQAANRLHSHKALLLFLLDRARGA